MSEISRIRLAKSREKRVEVFLNGKLAFSLQAEAVAREGLKVGQELADARVAALVKDERSRRCFDTAARYLGYRPRSEAEIREKLRLRGFDNDDIGAAVTRLKEQGLVDDAAFVQFWKDNRESFSPRSRQLTRLELSRKGVAREIIDRAVETVDDNDSAYRAAQSRAGRLPTSDYQAFRRRLGEYLRRRGFSYEVANHAVDLVWQETGAGKR